MQRALGPLFLTATGVTLNVVSQAIVDHDFHHPSTHLVPWLKFFSTTLFAFLARARARHRSGGRPASHTRVQGRLMLLIGLLDAAAYTSYCVGFFICGATLSGLLLAGLGQVITAAATHFILGRRLSWGQLLGITTVMVGLAIRALPAELFGRDSSSSSSTSSSIAGGVGGSAGQAEAQREQLLGVAFVALSAVLYSGLGISYDKLVKGTEKPPAHADVMWHTSKFGLYVASAYQLLYTAPRFGELITKRAAASGASWSSIALLLVLFGVLFNLHTFAQSLVFKSDGAVGVGLVSAVRGAVLTVVMGLHFCSPARPQLCITWQSGLSAAVTTLGGVIWVLAGARPPLLAGSKQESKLKPKEE